MCDPRCVYTDSEVLMIEKRATLFTNGFCFRPPNIKKRTISSPNNIRGNLKTLSILGIPKSDRKNRIGKYLVIKICSHYGAVQKQKCLTHNHNMQSYSK